MAQIIIENYEGKHNTPERYAAWEKLGHYRDLSTIWITPTRGTMYTRLAFNWMTIVGGFNQPLVKLCVEKYEVGQAYNEAITMILANPILSKYKYILTCEEDNSASGDALLKLYESIQSYDVVGGLYWTKGEGGVPMIWGDPKTPETYVPQAVQKDTLQECNGLGMGFTLFRLDLFKDPKFEQGQWFKTGITPEGAMTQDLYWFRNAQRLGYKFACDTRVKVGHIDSNGNIW